MLLIHIPVPFLPEFTGFYRISGFPLKEPILTGGCKRHRWQQRKKSNDAMVRNYTIASYPFCLFDYPLFILIVFEMYFLQLLSVNSKPHITLILSAMILNFECWWCKSGIIHAVINVIFIQQSSLLTWFS
jgi:hypothetical protein